MARTGESRRLARRPARLRACRGLADGAGSSTFGFGNTSSAVFRDWSTPGYEAP